MPEPLYATLVAFSSADSLLLIAREAKTEYQQPKYMNGVVYGVLYIYCAAARTVPAISLQMLLIAEFLVA